MTIPETFTSLVECDPDATALIITADGSRISRNHLLERSHQIESLLEALSLQPGDVVSVQLPNSLDFVASFLAATRRGLISLPIDRDATAAEADQLSRVFPIRAAIQRIRERTAVSAVTTGLPPFANHRAVLLKLTSGTTGSPKAVLTTEANLISDFENIVRSMRIEPEDRNFGAIPFSHSYGFSNLVTPLLLQGTSIAVSNDYLPLAVIENCLRFECTVLPGIPIMFDHLSQTRSEDGDLRTIETIISAGAPLPAAVSRRFRDRFGKQIHTFYGCSECGGITYDRQGGAVERGEVGRAMEGVSLTTDSRSGRMIVRSAAVSPGYLGGTAEEAGRLREGTFLTDDIAVIGSEGEVRLTGRFGDLINTAGKKVNPREVEAVLLGVDGVREAKVYGQPAGARGEVIAAAVVADAHVTRDEIRKACMERLSGHKVPRVIKLIDSIPLDERGKVKKGLLVSMESAR